MMRGRDQPPRAEGGGRGRGADTLHRPPGGVRVGTRFSNLPLTNVVNVRRYTRLRHRSVVRKTGLVL